MRAFALLLLVMASLAFSSTLDYQDPFKVYANGEPIALTLGDANPLVTDWNSDGLKDLIVGQYSGGKLRYYQNDDSNDSPMFSDFAYMQADGSDITLSSG